MRNFEKILSGGDLRSIGNNDSVVSEIRNQANFDMLFKLLHHSDRLVVMRTADAIEKIAVDHPEYLSCYTQQVFDLCKTAVNKELKWHLAQLIPRLILNKDGATKAKSILSDWLFDKNNSNIVRVNALQGLFDLADDKASMDGLFAKLEKEQVPSISARIRKLRNKLQNQRR
ncbi:MAG: hypothetical protein ACXVJB_13000 [Mucilaginibacter sp.]